MIGAYFDGELVGFIMLANAGRFGITGQIISSLKHRDKSPNNALIAKAVEVCAQQGLGYLIYLYWSEDSLAEFKRRCGFEPVRVPRYWVPLTWKGRLRLRRGCTAAGSHDSSLASSRVSRTGAAAGTNGGGVNRHLSAMRTGSNKTLTLQPMPGIAGIFAPHHRPSRNTRSGRCGDDAAPADSSSGTAFAPDLGVYGGWVAHAGSYAARQSARRGGACDCCSAASATAATHSPAVRFAAATRRKARTSLPGSTGCLPAC